MATTTPVGTLYRGGDGMWTWVLHRITGVSVFFFLFVHVLDTALVRYHALNGIRVILVDFWSRGPRYQRAMTWVIAGIWLVVMIPGTYRMLTHTAEALFGSTP